ncbi:hypothetical protein ACJONO_05975, partial [Mycoplasmopsis synoviae]
IYLLSHSHLFLNLLEFWVFLNMIKLHDSKAEKFAIDFGLIKMNIYQRALNINLNLQSFF